MNNNKKRYSMGVWNTFSLVRLAAHVIMIRDIFEEVCRPSVHLLHE